MAKMINGVMLGRPKRTAEQVEADFLSRFTKTEGCWIWHGTIEKQGYGVLQIEKKQWRAHRYAYVRAYGPIADDVLVCHKCNTKLCVNPEHLYAGTHKENMRDTVIAETQAGQHNGRAKLTEADVIEIRRLYAEDDRSQSWIAARYKIAQTRVSDIVRGLQWKHVGGKLTNPV